MAGELRLNKRHTKLLSEERALVPVRELRVPLPNLYRERATFIAKAYFILALHESLRGCDANPANYLDCQNDPDVNSNCQVKHSHSLYFERNGTVGEEIYAVLPGGADMAFRHIKHTTAARGYD